MAEFTGPLYSPTNTTYQSYIRKKRKYNISLAFFTYQSNLQPPKWSSRSKTKPRYSKSPTSAASPTSTSVISCTKNAPCSRPLTSKPSADYLGTQQGTSSPITGSWFRIERGPESTPPKYDYDEVGVVIEGEMTFRDETGQTVIVKAGDTFFFPRGSTITFSTDSYGVAWKCGARLPSKL